MSNDTQAAPPDMPPDDELVMGIDPWERNWMKLSVALLVVFAAAVTVAGFAAGFQLPGSESQVDPTTIADEGRWATPGLVEVGEGRYEAYVLAQTFSFSPPELVVPVGAEVDIYVTSVDVQHGFKITDTNVNMQIVPGQVSKLSYTFDEVGDFPYICTEYCGSAHHAMAGRVRVLSEVDYAAEQAGEQAGDESTSDQTEDEG